MKCTLYTREMIQKTREWTWTEGGQLHLICWEGDGTTILVNHFQAHEGEDNWKWTAWIYEVETMHKQPNCFLHCDQLGSSG